MEKKKSIGLDHVYSDFVTVVMHETCFNREILRYRCVGRDTGFDHVARRRSTIISVHVPIIKRFSQP